MKDSKEEKNMYTKEDKIEEIVVRMDSIIEILRGLQLLNLKSNQIIPLNIADFFELPIEELASIRVELEKSL